MREALDALGRSRLGADWTPYCPLCLTRASGDGLDAAARRQKAKYLFGVFAGPGLLVFGLVFFYVMFDRVLIQYVPALVSFFVLALACGLVLAAYGAVGLVRRHGLFHRHPPPDDATAVSWISVSDEFERLTCAGSLRVYALTQDGELHRISGDQLDPQTIRRSIRGDDENAVWAALRKRLALRNAPSGEFVVARDDVGALTEPLSSAGDSV